MPLDDENSNEKKTDGIDIPGLMKDIALTGLATVFMTEDSVRKYLKELKVPKELIGSALEGAGKKKDDLYRIVGTEVAKVISRMDLAKEFSKFLENHKVTVQLTFEPKSKKKEDEDGNG